jgi:hypothetical protein
MHRLQDVKNKRKVLSDPEHLFDVERYILYSFRTIYETEATSGCSNYVGQMMTKLKTVSVFNELLAIGNIIGGQCVVICDDSTTLKDGTIGAILHYTLFVGDNVRTYYLP